MMRRRPCSCPGSTNGQCATSANVRLRGTRLLRVLVTNAYRSSSRWQLGQRGISRVAEQQREVESARRQPFAQEAAVGVDDFQPKRRKALPAPAQHEYRDGKRYGRRQSDGDLATGQRGGFSYGVARSFRVRQHEPRIPKGYGAGLGQCHAPARALEQSCAQFVLERGDLLAECRLRNVQSRSSLQQPAGLANTDEVAQLSELQEDASGRCAERSAVVAAHCARQCTVVPLLGTDLQRPSHPLRLPLRQRGRRPSRTGRARPADRHAAVGLAALRDPSGRGEVFQLPSIKPLFDVAPFQVCGQRNGDKNVQLWARSAEGHLAMSASATLA